MILLDKTPDKVEICLVENNTYSTANYDSITVTENAGDDSREHECAIIGVDVINHQNNKHDGTDEAIECSGDNHSAPDNVWSEDIDLNKKNNNFDREKHKEQQKLVRKKRKINKNIGDANQTSRRIFKKKKALQNLRECRNKCATKLNEKDRETIFKEYWAMRGTGT